LIAAEAGNHRSLGAVDAMAVVQLLLGSMYAGDSALQATGKYGYSIAGAESAAGNAPRIAAVVVQIGSLRADDVLHRQATKGQVFIGDERHLFQVL